MYSRTNRPVSSATILTLSGIWVPFRDERGGGREIDFVLHGARDYAIEIEGAASHHGPYIGQKKFDDEKLRQRSIGAAGYVYTPFTFNQLKSGDALRSFGALCDEDEDPNPEGPRTAAGDEAEPGPAGCRRTAPAHARRNSATASPGAS